MNTLENFIQSRFGKGLGDQILINSKSLNKLFLVNGIPLFWFYKRYLQKHVLPTQINAFSDMINSKKFGNVKKMKSDIYSYTFKKYIYAREIMKIKSANKINVYSPERKALFLTYPDHLKEERKLYRFQGIIDCLDQDRILKTFPLFVTSFSSSQKLNAVFPNLYQYCDETIIRNAHKQARIFAHQWSQLDENDLCSAMMYERNCLWPYLSPAFSFFMSPEFIFLILTYFETCKKIIEKENISITFISGQNGLFERCFAAASKSKGIPCMLVPHGFMIGNLPAQDVLDTIYIPVFNKNTASSFINLGVPSKQIRVTGPAMYDSIMDYKKKCTIKNSNERKILLLTQPLVEDNFISKRGYFSMVESVLKEMVSLPEVKIVIKLHPREKGFKIYKKIAKKFSKKNISIQQKGELNLLYSLLIDADVVVNFFSTAGILEASILDVPSITFPFNKRKISKYGKFDPSLYVFEINLLKAAVEKLIKNPRFLRKKREEMVKEFCTFIDGKSSRRVTEWAYQLISTQHQNNL